MLKGNEDTLMGNKQALKGEEETIKCGSVVKVGRRHFLMEQWNSVIGQRRW